jgi:hypothetical protein
MTYALLILLFAGPEPGDTPRAAVDRFVAAVRKVDLAGAYEQLGDGARGLLDKQMGRAAKRVGLDPATATPAQVIAEFEKRFANDAGKQLIAAADVAVLESRVENDRATAKVRVTYAGRQETVTLTLVRTRGRWQINGVDASKARSRANEIAAIATLRNITSAQAQFQACAKADANQNGTGEYGTFGELSGAVEVRGGAKLNPPVLSTIFRKVDGGIVTRSGYHYRIFLCDAQGNAVGEEKGTVRRAGQRRRRGEGYEGRRCRQGGNDLVRLCVAGGVRQDRQAQLLRQPVRRHPAARPQGLQRHERPERRRSLQERRDQGTHHRCGRGRCHRQRRQRMETGPLTDR